jgi:hypothetical protein
MLLLSDPLDEPHASQGVRLIHLVELLQELNERLSVLELQNNIIREDGGQLDCLETHIDVLQLYLANVVPFDVWIEDVDVVIVQANVHLLLIVVPW